MPNFTFDAMETIDDATERMLSRTDNSTPKPRYFVRYRGFYGIRFHTNVSGKHFTEVRDSEATLFDDRASAYNRAVEHGIPLADALVLEAHVQKDECRMTTAA